MDLVPPKNIIKLIRCNKGVCNELTRDQKLHLRLSSESLTFSAVKFMSDETGMMGFGLSVQRGDKLGPFKIAQFSWSNVMHQWSAVEWAWFLVLLMNQASEVFCSFNPRDRGSRTILIDFFYKLKPVSPIEFIDDLEPLFLRLVELDRFRTNSNSIFYNPVDGDNTTQNDVGRIIFLRSRLMIETDIARLFDTSWYWKRAAELLQISIEDRSLKPACTYLVDTSSCVYTYSGKYYPTPLAYIEARLVAPSPAHITSYDKENVIKFIMDIISANSKGSTFGKDSISMSDYLSTCACNNGQNAVPRALKAAFKKYEIYVPEMENVLKMCGQCRSPRPKSACACKTVSYCDSTCQKQHWRVHKLECVYRVKEKKTSTCSGGGGDVQSATSPAAGTNNGITAGTIEGKRKRKPSKAAIQKQFERWMKGDTACPSPGTEECEAWKVGGLTMMAHCSVSEKRILQEAMDKQAETEAAFWRKFPTRPNWADGT
jgi:hypothetical protein